jgi:hypothetical protein
LKTVSHEVFVQLTEGMKVAFGQRSAFRLCPSFSTSS